MKRVLFALLAGVVLALSGCSGVTVSTDSPVSTSATSDAIDREAAKKLEAAIRLSLGGYDVTVSASDDNDDGKLDVLVTVSGGITISEYSFGMVANETMKAVNSDLHYYPGEIGEIKIYGYGNERVISWRTSNLLTGDFLDIQKDPAKSRKITDATLSDVLNYCEYIPPEDLAKNEIEKNESRSAIATEPETAAQASTAPETTSESLSGAIAYSRAGTQYYQYGVIDFGTVVEILGYENDDWINLIFERKNAYIEAKYYSPLTDKTGMIIDPAQVE